jgi:signal transduction histidine kinase
MIKKLRRKFILINMMLVSAVLITVFIVLCVSTYTRLRTDTETAARMTLEYGNRPGGFRPEIMPGRPIPDRDIAWNIPAFYVRAAADKTIIFSDYGRVSITDETAAAAVISAMELGQSSGIINDLNLRFVARKMQNGETAIAFADSSSETIGMRQIVINSLLIGGGGLVMLFFISVFLAHLSIKPVEEAWSAKQQFIADASHELKTPLTVIMANTGIITSQPDTKVSEMLHWLENTNVEAVRMKNLVENMLEIAKGDFTKENLILNRFDLSETVTSTLLSFEPLAFKKNVVLSGDIQPTLKIKGNSERIARLVAILLDNAIKYTGSGGTAHINLCETGTHISLTVQNTGTIIPKEHIKKIFDRFYRADGSRVSDERGSFGLGLSIAHQIAEDHGAKISVQSDKEHGTVFTVYFKKL